MKATVDAGALAAGVATVARFIGRGGSLPAFDCVHVTAGDGRVLLVAGNLDATARVTVEAEVGAAGVALIPARMLGRVLTQLDGPVALDHSDNDATITAGAATVTLRCQPADTYPRLDWGEDAPLVAFGEAWDRIGRIAHAASTDAARMPLHGIHFDPAGVARASDTYRAARCAVPAGLDGLLPVDASRVAVKVLGADVSIGQPRPGAMVLDDGVVRIRTTLGPEGFPATGIDGHLAGIDQSRWFTVDGDALMAAVGVATAVDTSSAVVGGATVRLGPGDEGRLEVSSIDGGQGSAVATVPVDGEPWRVALSAPFLADAVAAAGPGELRFTGGESQRPVGLSTGDVDLLVMPRRLS